MSYLLKKLLLGIELVANQSNKVIVILYLYKNIGVDGVKTGYLAVEKYSLASSMIKKDRRLIAVASGFEHKKFKKYTVFKTT